ncbi:DUF998 domain-containing protein [Thermosipho atlanticus]|uniref:Hypothetical membrane protein n=1 Tax=Thermosipho atlanticus DSM 15807 TaxID=1123380 RepID=A0A1M5T836_9BACT|nr:DUF998 domain-containing protein [Thermosipho atlanticus]SHH46770.1 hypothetical membrane protein [Thermosipho atlanticus DSM 15807]
MRFFAYAQNEKKEERSVLSRSAFYGKLNKKKKFTKGAKNMKYWKLLGLFSIGVFIAGILVSNMFNPWFNISIHTFSKLGKPGFATYPWIFSCSLIIGGILMSLYGFFMTLKSYSKSGTIGGSYVLLSGIFMILTGLFPDGTKPHDFIALSTFLLFYIGEMIYGFGSSKAVNFSTTLVMIVALIALLFNPFPSLGYLEIFGVSLVVVDLIIIMFESI